MKLLINYVRMQLLAATTEAAASFNNSEDGSFF
jgi:hypothetical protein